MENKKTSLLAYLKEATSLLQGVGIPTPDLDARLLLEDALQKDKTFCVLNQAYLLTAQEQRKFQAFLERRLLREPVAKILGHKEFWSLSFKTTKETLDPRPDSETLIEAVLETYSDKNEPLKILDLGTGTGCLILTLLHEYKQATGLAVDISENALEVARYNANSLNLQDRVTFFKTNWTKDLIGTFDLIVSNPPYIPPSHAKTLEPELAFDPDQALYSEHQDGLSAYITLAQNLAKHLTPHGKIFLEFGQGQEEKVQQLFEAQDFHHFSSYEDISNTTRISCFIKKT